jgi:adhesin HecA-like repeat protein
MLHLVIARDGTDSEAPQRRQRVRETHLEGARALATAGTLTYAGALLNDAGGMVGSALVIEAESVDAVREILHRDIYHREGVWQTYEIHPFKRAV